MRHLSIEYDGQNPRTGHNEWVQFLHPLTAVQTLDLFAKHGGYDDLFGLGDVTREMFADVLPALGLLYSDCPQVTFFEEFITVFRLSGRPVTVVRSPSELHEGLDSYLREQYKNPYESDTSSDM